MTALRPTISKSQFYKLKGGDLVLWRGNYLRTILDGPGDLPGHKRALDFVKRRRSWRNRTTTVYFYNDVKHLIRVIGKRIHKLLLNSEAEILREMGFNVRKEFLSELRREFDNSKRMGRPICRNFHRMKRLIQQRQLES